MRFIGKIEECVPFSGRGIAILFEAPPQGSFSRQLTVHVERPGGSAAMLSAPVEWARRKGSGEIALYAKGTVADAPPGSIVSVADAPPTP